MQAFLTILKYITVVIPLVEFIAKGGVRIYRTIKSAAINHKANKEKTALRKKLEAAKKAGKISALLFCLLLAGCASPLFDAVRAQLPQKASDIQLDLEGFVKADVIYLTADGSEGRLSLVCEVKSTDLTGDIGVTYSCPIVGNQFGLEVAYLELDGTGKVLNIKGFDNLLYSVELEK